MKKAADVAGVRSVLVLAGLWTGLLYAGLVTGQETLRAGAPIDDSYIVVLKAQPPEVSQSSDARAFAVQSNALAMQSVMSVAEASDGEIEYEYEAAIVGFSLRTSAQRADELRAHPLVRYVEQDRVVTIDADQRNPPSWGLDRVDARAGYDNNYHYDVDGSGVDIYIIDTGILQTHEDFGGRVREGFDVIGGGVTDCNGHGTHVAGTAAGTEFGIAKNANLYPVRVLDCAGAGSTSGVIAGIDWVVENASGPSVANMSLGGGAQDAMDVAVRNAIDQGITMVVAAGNNNADACFTSPARVREAITVGATSENDDRAGFSNFGTCVNIFAPGDGITSAWIGSDDATNTTSGTSMATPHVAGVAALYLTTNPGATPDDVTGALLGDATQGPVGNPGNGSPNLFLHSLVAEVPPPPEEEPPPEEPDACEGGTSLSGALLTTAPNHFAYAPNGQAFFSETGALRGCLVGDDGTNFDLWLYEWREDLGQWTLAAQGIEPGSTETVTYDGPSTYYVWLVYTREGAGDFTLKISD